MMNEEVKKGREEKEGTEEKEGREAEQLSIYAIYI
jgi:hypothetical protein